MPHFCSNDLSRTGGESSLPAPQLNSLRSFFSEKISVTSHGGKRHVMVLGRQLMAQNDSSWEKGEIRTGLQYNLA
jgi:hypothetical protein